MRKPDRVLDYGTIKKKTGMWRPVLLVLLVPFTIGLAIMLADVFIPIIAQRHRNNPSTSSTTAQPARSTLEQR